ncbi:MAG: hypothetical protein AAGE93_16310 [Bacteroidota bacterium]
MDDSTFKDTLAKLRNRSWEMELLISGFVLVLLLPIPELLWQQGRLILTSMNVGVVQQLFSVALVIGLFGSRILIVNLIIYLFLRGFWIGIVGLISAFPKGIDWPRTSYQESYQQYLERKTPKVETYVDRLNKITSSVFSFSFLLVFLITAALFALLPVILTIILVNTVISDLSDTYWVNQVADVVIPALFAIYFGLSTVFLIDFLTLGLIKRIRWQPFVKLYFPLYRFFRLLTLAPLYTPIYYTLISNVPKRVIASVLISYLAIFFFFTNFSYSEEIFIPNQDGAFRLHYRHYEDKLEASSLALLPLIPSEYVEHSHLRLFLPYLVSDNDSLQQVCPEVETFRESGFTTSMQVTFGFSPPDTLQSNSPSDNEENVVAALNCLANVYQIYVDDSLYQPATFYFYRRAENNQPGLLTYLPVASLPSGPHQLTVKKRDYSSGVPDDHETYYIPFVKE